MLNMLKRQFDSLLGRGECAVTIPVMDGPFLPNQFLEEGEILFEASLLDNLALAGETLFYSSGTEVFSRNLTAPSLQGERVHTGNTMVSSLAARGTALAIGLDMQGLLIVGGSHDGKMIGTLDGKELNCITAILFLSDDEVVVGNGSAANSASRWKYDLVQLGRSGSVWHINLASGNARMLAANMAFPYGLAQAQDGGIFVSECWKHRIVKIPTDGGAPQLAAGNLPGFPARITPGHNGTFLLSFLSARNQLYEFVLREREYCRRMMGEIGEDYWMAPALKSNLSFKEQIQGDSVKMMGVLKPWAPPRSYGLVTLCDKDMDPVVSWHSRADGTNHGTTSVIVENNAFIVGAKGPGRAVKVPLTHPELMETSK
ncbi:hypothetical protein JWJ88_10400 [Paracoccus methylovorus]|uniref:Strictosidine synthase conserved region domain-containing protein n=1 Tax=Paracoccus methylovorus TaxID=2812658 RepID=A0ABX7JFG5_9RHOB|nr:MULTISPECIES: hypothetical protein [Paracoccus]QRZ12983.1 hypothetical protein JWJ88_10400 [Paracoccus methylovorus]